MRRHIVYGHAIVSADDRIAAGNGETPTALRNDADWLRFQAALDAASVTVLGRRGHLGNPNPKGRNRLVLSSSADAIEQRPDGWWWNPAFVPVEEALAHAAPGGGVAAIVGGTRVFDLFLDYGYDVFDLVRAEDVLLPGGLPLFSLCDAGRNSASLLGERGLTPGQAVPLDPVHRVVLVPWTQTPGTA